MQFKKLLLFFITMPLSMCAMDTTFQTQTTLFPQPRFARENLNSWQLSISQNKATNSFNREGETVALLNFNGPQELLKRFVDKNLPFNDTTTFGKAILSADFSCLRYDFLVTQNFGPHFFVKGSTALRYSNLKNLEITPILNNCVLITSAQINSDPALKQYLTELAATLNNNTNGIATTAVGPSLVQIGYTTSLTNFEKLDFIDITAQTGLYIPIITLDQTCNTTLTAMPFTDIVNLGIPFMLDCAFGFYDWLNIGSCIGFMPFISSDKIIPLNTTKTNTAVLIDHAGMCKIKQDPFLYLNFYVEAEQLVPRLSILFGLSYAKQYGAHYAAQDTTMFDTTMINQYPTLHPWQILNITVSAELDMAKEHQRLWPSLKIVYVHPVWGTNIFKTNSVAGQLALECAYNF
jgi:hypothetical protein